jgi:hypothetical protein
MKRLLLATTLALLPTACGPPEPQSGPEAVCRQEAYNDPEFKRLLEIAATSSSYAFRTTDERDSVYKAAYTRCMQRVVGSKAGGGVEPVRAPQSLFNGIR